MEISEAELDHTSHASRIVSLKAARIRDTHRLDIWNGIQLWVLKDLTQPIMTQNSILVDVV